MESPRRVCVSLTFWSVTAASTSSPQFRLGSGILQYHLIYVTVSVGYMRNFGELGRVVSNREAPVSNCLAVLSLPRPLHGEKRRADDDGVLAVAIA